MTQDKSSPKLNPAAGSILSLYVHRLAALAVAVRDGCDAVFSDAPIPEREGYLKVSPELHARIDGVLVSAANIRKLVQTPAEKGKKESTRVFEFRRERTRLLAEFLAGVSLAATVDAQVRNSLEHFDEYLDKLGASLNAGEDPPQRVAAFNMVFSSWQIPRAVVRADVYPIRVYVAADSTYYNFERKIDLSKLREESAAILARIAESGILRGREEPGAGGLMLVFPATSKSG